MSIFDAVFIGDANIDLIVAGHGQIPERGQEIFVDDMTVHVGGGAALSAISLAKLGLRVAFNGTLGNDLFGSYIRERFAQSGIDTRLIGTSRSHHTGISIALNPETDRSFITYAGSNRELRVDRLDFGQIALGRHAHFTGYSGSGNHPSYMTLAKSLKARGLTLSCDVGWDDSGQWYEGIFELMRYVDVFLMNETEALHYARQNELEDSLRVMAEHGRHIVVKQGSQGAVAVREGVVSRCPAFAVEAVNTTGAGDAFNAGYLFGYLTGADAGTSLLYGNACGAMSVSAAGEEARTPDPEGLRTFIREHRHPAARRGRRVSL